MMTRAVSSHKQLLLLILCAAMFLDALDTSLVSVALPSIKNDLGLSNETLQWLVSGYVVAYGGFLLFGGRVADLFGRRRVFLASMVLFAVASVAGGLVSSGDLLIITRVAKGLAAAFTAPAAMSIITTSFSEGHERNRALGFYTATAAAGYSLGLVLSGLLTQVNWRLVFFLPAVIAVVVIVLTPMVIPRSAAVDRTGRSFDVTGAFTITAAILLFVYGIVEGPSAGWGQPSTIVVLAVAVVLFAAFVVIERRHSDPMVPLRLFRSRTRSSASILAILFASASLGWQFTVTLYIQQLLHLGALETALLLLPVGVSTPPVAQAITPRLLARLPMKWVAGIGILIQGSGILLFAFVGLHTNYVGLMLPGLLLHGIGNGIVFPTMNIAGVRGVSDHQQGVASGIITGSYQLGVGIGVAVLTGIMAANSGPGPVGQLAGYHAAFITASIFSLLGSIVSFVGLPGRERRVPAGEVQAVAAPAQV